MKTTSSILFKFVAPVTTALLFSSCAQYSDDNPPTPNPNQKKIPRAVFVNPYPVGSYENFITDPLYSRHYKVWKHPELFESTPATQTRVVINLATQRGTMYKGDEVILDYPVSTGTRRYPTPARRYQVLEKIESEKRSSLYGKIYDSNGSIVKRNADSREDAVPEGGRFEGAAMKYWMRLSWDGIGMHLGTVRRSPQSHGCIRTHRSVVKSVFRKVRPGTPVTVVAE